MLYACATRFDVMGILKSFVKFLGTRATPMVLHFLFGKNMELANSQMNMAKLKRINLQLFPIILFQKN